MSLHFPQKLPSSFGSFPVLFDLQGEQYKAGFIAQQWRKYLLILAGLMPQRGIQKDSLKLSLQICFAIFYAYVVSFQVCVYNGTRSRRCIYITICKDILIRSAHLVTLSVSNDVRSEQGRGSWQKQGWMQPQTKDES